MKYQSLILVLASAVVFLATAAAQNPVDITSAPIQEKLNQAPQNIAQHIVEGNVTPEHLQKDVNATAQELKKTAAQEIQQHANVTTQDLQKMAEQEIKNQVAQKVQQPGFEAAFAAIGILATACVLRRRG
jgi:PGF-CTERM protein